MQANARRDASIEVPAICPVCDEHYKSIRVAAPPGLKIALYSTCKPCLAKALWGKKGSGGKAGS
ncbi:MAG: hypothetical protein ABI839_01470 [Verrucomicrobiota bacterium]